MALTNQQVYDSIIELTRAQKEAMEVIVQAQQATVTSFQAMIKMLLAHDLEEHADFRKCVSALTTSTKLLEQKTKHHDKNWGKLWALAAGAYLIPVGGGIVMFYVNRGGP